MKGWDLTKIKKRIIIEYCTGVHLPHLAADNRRSLWRYLALAGGVLLVSGAIFYLFWANLFAEGMMRGGDEAAHMFIPRYIVDYFKAHGRIPVINPYWYNGIETLHHAPYAVYLPVAALYILTKDIYLTNRLITLFLFLVAGWAMFFLLYRKFSLKSALIGGILFPLAPIVFYLVRTSITRATPYVLVPFLFYYTNEILEKKFQFKNFLILALLFAVAIFSHPIYAVTVILCLAFYAAVRLILEREIPFKRFFTLFWVFLVSCGLVAWFAIPFLLEPAGYGSRISTDLLQGLKYGLQINLVLKNGFPMIILAAFSFIFRQRTKKDWALLVSVGFASLLATEIAVPFYQIFPLIYPYSTLIWVVFGVIYWAATAFELPDLKAKWRLPLQIVAVPLAIAVCLFFFNRENQFFRKWAEPFERAMPELTDKLKSIENDGRVLTIKSVGKLDWAIPAVARKYFSEGHYFATTRMNREIAWLGDALNNDYPAYVVAKMRLFNDRYFVATRDLNAMLAENPPKGPSFWQLLEKEGFVPTFFKNQGGVEALYWQDKPSSYLIPLEEKTLIIGQHGYNYAAFAPDSYLAGSVYLDDYDLDFLKNFDNLVLYGFGYHNKAKAEQLVRDFATSGGRVTIDLLNIQNSRLESEDIFLGVQSATVTAKAPIKLEMAQNGQNVLLPLILELPTVKDFGLQGLAKAKMVPLKKWAFTEYSGLDGALARRENREDGGNLYNLIGYKNIANADGENVKVWFIGGNLIYHAYLTHNGNEQKFIRLLTTGGSSQSSKETSDINITSQNLDPEAGLMEFDYTADEQTPLLISYTISPHWKAYLNGQPLKIYDVDSMMALNLPVGSGRVTLKYENLSNHYFAGGVTFATLILIGIIFYLSRRRKKRDVSK